jgi:formylglycine-generating enzyme required for sulfatase activity
MARVVFDHETAPGDNPWARPWIVPGRAYDYTSRLTHQEAAMAFDVRVWRERVARHGEGWSSRWEKARAAGVTSLYGFLSAMALWPVVEAVREGDLAALLALGSVAAGIGSNLLANQIQSWKDETDAASQLAQAAAENEEIQAALDAVLEKLDVVAQAQASLDESEQAWFVETLQEELVRLGNQARFQAVLVGSGAIAQGAGAVAAGVGGIAVGRSVGGDVLGPGARKETHVHPSAEERRADEARRRYLRRLYQQCNALPLGAMGGDEGTGEEVTLEQVYVDLNTRTQISLSEEEKAQQGRELVAPGHDARLLTAREAVVQNRRLALLGDPGSGKSTFVKQLSAWLAAAQLKQRDPIPELEADLLPVLVVLRELGVRLAKLDLDGLPQPERERQLVAAVRQHWRDELAACGSEEWAMGLEDALTEGNVLLAFDGLDEVAETGRGRVRQAVQAFLQDHPNIRRVIVASRIRSYVGDAALPGFAEHTLAPFDDGQIEQFIEAWYRAQVPLGRMNEAQAEDNAHDLQSAALSADLRELASNPMLLTTMAIIHQREVGLPRERVRLYSLAVQNLLGRWQMRKGIAVSTALEEVLRDDLKLRAIMERLGYEVHLQQAQQQGAADLLRKDLLVLLEDPAYLGETGLAGEFLDYVDQRAGLLVGQGGDEMGRYPHTYRFPHRTFQEYLAGCYMVGRRGTAREYWQRAAQGDTWYLAALLGAEELLYNRRSAKDLLDLAYELCPEAQPAREDAWRAVLWSGQMAVRLDADEIRRDDERPDGGNAYLGRLVPRLVGVMRESPLGPIERAEAGNALARLGDPRFRENAWYLPDEPLLGFVEVPEGSFSMGTREEEIPALMERLGGDREWYEDEIPQHEVPLPKYYVARYPVTVAQFRAFAEAGGYREQRYWQEAESVGRWRDGRIKRTLFRVEEGDIKEIDEWDDAPTAASEMLNRPVVEATWYEALAYCRWLTETLRAWAETPEPLATLLREEGWTITLPSEAEWEKAARGTDGRRFPWGDELDPNQANYVDTKINATSAVGCFPSGASPPGVEDLSGNAWEWTRSVWGKSYGEPDFVYPYDAKDGRENLESEALRVLRGGAFRDGAWVVRCACRSRDDPSSRGRVIGFRVVASPVHL